MDHVVKDQIRIYEAAKLTKWIFRIAVFITVFGFPGNENSPNPSL